MSAAPVLGAPLPLQPITSMNNKKLSEATISELIAMLNSSDGLIRHRAHHALLKIGEPAVEALINALGSPDDFLRWEAIKVLGQIGSVRAVPALIDALEDKRYTIRWLAAEGLIVVGLDGLKPLLHTLEVHPDSTRVREGVHHVLYALIQNQKLAARMKQAVLPILQAIDKAESPAAIEKEVRAARNRALP